MSKKAVVEKVLLSIYQEEGVLLAETIVERARMKSHPLHDSFEWDNRKAGEEYRLLQATKLIRTVEVKISTADDEYRIRAFHPMRSVGRDPGGYVHESDITGAERPVLLQTMHRDWTALRRRYGHMAEFWEMVGTEQERAVG